MSKLPLPWLHSLIRRKGKLPLVSQVREALDEQTLYRKSARYMKSKAIIGTLIFTGTSHINMTLPEQLPVNLIILWTAVLESFHFSKSSNCPFMQGVLNT